jgi:sensor histidine kinase YesM
MNYKGKLKEYSWPIVISATGSFVTTYFSCPQCTSDFTKYARFSFLMASLWIVLWIGNSEFNTYLSTKISWIKTPVKRLVVGIIATILYTIVAVFVILKGWEISWNFKIDNYLEVFIPSMVITFFISLFFHGRGFLMAWRKAAIDAEHFQQESIKAQYQSLKNQVNPHFLFNSLNALTNLVYEDQDKAAKFIKQLSQVYRYVLDTRNKEVVPLQDELKFIESYLFLEQIRFGNKLKVDIRLNNIQTQVAPLALQMLIENAIKHNIVSEEDPLTIQIYADGNFILVENNLQRKKVLDEDSSGMGLENICKRYEFLSDHKVKVSDENNSFKVSIPILFNL